MMLPAKRKKPFDCVAPLAVLLLLSIALFNSRAIGIRPDEPPSLPRLLVRLYQCNMPQTLLLLCFVAANLTPCA